MKKLIFLVFLVIPFMGWSQTDSVMYFFGKVLNEYRAQNGLNRLVVEHSLKNISESHAEYMLKNRIITHNGLHEKKIELFPNQYVTENVAYTAIILPYSRMKTNDSVILKLISDSKLVYLENSLSFNLAITLFYQWKNSPGHNKVLLESKSTKFYLAYKRSPYDDYRIVGERCYSGYFTM